MGEEESLTLELSMDKVRQCVDDLLKMSKPADDAELLDEADKVLLQFSFKLIPDVQNKTIKIKLPYPLYRVNKSVCLFVKDLDRNDREYEKTISYFDDLLRRKGVTSISEIIPLKALKLEYKSYESKQQLSNRHDLFLADERIIRLLPSLLGKHFYARRRNPTQINLLAKDLRKAVDVVLNNTFCNLSGRGSVCTCTVAYMDMEPEQIAKNIISAVQEIASRIPGGPKNIRNLVIKTPKSKPSTIFYDKGNKMDVRLPPKRRKIADDEPEEISSLFGAKVQVTQSGYVKVLKEGDKKEKKKRRKGPTKKYSLVKPRLQRKSKVNPKVI